MENKNGQLKRNVPDGLCFWRDDHSLISHSSGLLLVTQSQWDSLTDDVKATFRPIDTGAGMVGQGLVVGNMLLVFLD